MIGEIIPESCIHLCEEPVNVKPLPDDTYNGFSLGRWEGDTLVADTTGFNDKTWFDRAGNFHSNAMKLEERFMGMSRALLKLSGSLVHDYATISDDSRILTARRVPGGQRPARAYLDILAPGGTPSPLRAPRRPPSAAPSSRRASVSHGAARGAFG